MSDEDEQADFSLADNQPFQGMSVSRGRIYRPAYKVVQPSLTPLQAIAKHTFEVAQRMRIVEKTMTEKLDELNSLRSRFISLDPHLAVSLADCFWSRSGNNLTLTHIRGSQEGIPSLSISILPQQINFADAVFKHAVRGGTSNDAALKAAQDLARNEVSNTEPKEQTNKKDIT